VDEVLCFADTGFIAPETRPALPAVPSEQSEASRLRQFVSSFPGAYAVRCMLRNVFFQAATRNLAHKKTIYHEPAYILKPFPGAAVATIHDLSHIHYPDFHPRERVRFMERQLPKTLIRADFLLTDSEFVRHELVSIFNVRPERVRAIALGADPHFRPRGPEETRAALARHGLEPDGYILAVATREPRKNLDGLLRAFMRLPEKVRKRRPLALAGTRGWRCGELERMIDALEITGEVRRLGYVPAGELPLLYAGATAFAYPSFYEGFGLPPLEAMASGVPVLSSCGSSMAEVVGEAGILVDPHDEEAIAQELEQLLEDAELRRKIAAQGLQRAAMFSWDNCVRGTVGVYRQVLGL
jgi:alpha-1,3-rhamnosyl/mannosyltransferase